MWFDKQYNLTFYLNISKMSYNFDSTSSKYVYRYFILKELKYIVS